MSYRTLQSSAAFLLLCSFASCHHWQDLVQRSECVVSCAQQPANIKTQHFQLHRVSAVIHTIVYSFLQVYVGLSISNLSE